MTLESVSSNFEVTGKIFYDVLDFVDGRIAHIVFDRTVAPVPLVPFIIKQVENDIKTSQPKDTSFNSDT